MTTQTATTHTRTCRDCGGPMTRAFPTTGNYIRCRRCGHIFPSLTIESPLEDLQTALDLPPHVTIGEIMSLLDGDFGAVQAEGWSTGQYESARDAAHEIGLVL